MVYLYCFPICYKWSFDFDGVYGICREGNSYNLKIKGSNYDYLGNRVEVINIKIDTEKEDVGGGLGSMFVFSEYRLPFWFTFSSTPLQYEEMRNSKPDPVIYYDRIQKKVFFVIEDKTFEITQRGKFLVYKGINILIERDSTLHIHIDKDGTMSATRQYYRP
jgi:hypothetical protein